MCGHEAVEVAVSLHYPGAFTEAALTGLGAFLFSLVISYARLGKRIDRLAEPFTASRHPPEPIPNP
jgi:hypothetical protein